MSLGCVSRYVGLCIMLMLPSFQHWDEIDHRQHMPYHCNNDARVLHALTYTKRTFPRIYRSGQWDKKCYHITLQSCNRNTSLSDYGARPLTQWDDASQVRPIITSISHILKFGRQNICCKHQYWFSFLLCPRSYIFLDLGTAQSMDLGVTGTYPVRSKPSMIWASKETASEPCLFTESQAPNKHVLCSCLCDFTPAAGSCSRPHKWTGFTFFFFGLHVV